MKIKSEENVYIIPDLNGACAISSSYVDDIVQCLFSYFVAKKKNKCAVIDEDGDLMKNDSVSFIYIPKDDDLTPLFNLKNCIILVLFKIAKCNIEFSGIIFANNFAI